MNSVREFWHQKVIDSDLSVIARKIKDFDTFYDLFLIAIHKAKQNPYRPGWDLKYDLTGWYEYKFFSEELPAHQDKPDMRFVYHYDKNDKNFYLLAVGPRNSKETRDSEEQHSIYYISAKRLKRVEVGCWQIMQS